MVPLILPTFEAMHHMWTLDHSSHALHWCSFAAFHILSISHSRPHFCSSPPSSSTRFLPFTHAWLAAWACSYMPMVHNTGQCQCRCPPPKPMPPSQLPLTGAIHHAAAPDFCCCWSCSYLPHTHLVMLIKCRVVSQFWNMSCLETINPFQTRGDRTW